MDKQEHPESSQDPPPELFEPLTMKKIPAPPLRSRKKLQAPRQHRRPQRSYKSQSRLKKSSTRLPSQSPPEEVINISSLLTHPGDVSD
ncbi:hypothetical protein Zm00014a_029527 [Zea mays]|uniref:Uncharacterized protein n=1 Tax=Zea mays TaxID=4577 RepID=A0A3L6E3C9_MAIZE|nr:hypothetical protein Zm00014a_029527 [Zea mays]